MHALQLGFSLLCCHRYYARPLTPSAVPLTLTLTLKHLQQPLNALVPSTQCLLLRVNSHLHLFHGLPQQGQLLSLPFMLRLQLEEVLLWQILWRWWGKAVTPRHLTGATGPKGTWTGRSSRTLAETVERLIWAVSNPRLKGVGWAKSLWGHCSGTTIPRTVNDDVSFLLPWIIGVGWAGSGAVLWCRTVQVIGTMSGAVARAEPPSEVLVHMVFSIGVSLLPLLPQATVHLSVSSQLLLKLLNC